jgi:hypothetical protein
MLRWICGHTRRDWVRNDDIRERLGVTSVEEKLVQHRLRWFGPIRNGGPRRLETRGGHTRRDRVHNGGSQRHQFIMG